MILLQLIVPYVIAQNDDLLLKHTGFNMFSKYTVSVETDKNEFSIDENIYVKIKTNFEEDSFQEPNFEGFTIIGKTISNSISYNNGVRVRNRIMFYTLKPISSGEYTIKSPLFFVNGEKVQSQKKITVLDVTLKKQDKSELEIQAFANKIFYPEGTYRYVIGNEFGYIEISKNNTWEFYRKLTEKEFNMIKKIK